MPPLVQMRIEGLEELRDKLLKLKRVTGRKVVRKALNEASKPILRTAKAKVPVDTGLLRKSLGRKQKSYRGGRSVVIIGPRTGFKREVTVAGKKQVRNPAKYSHLVEFGTRRTAAKPFLRPAFDELLHQTVAAITNTIADGIEAEATKAK